MYHMHHGLLVFIPVAFLVAAGLVLFNYQRRRAAQKAFGDWQLLSATSRPLPAWRYWLRAGLAGLAAACVMWGLARPVLPDGSHMIAQGSVDVVAAVDVSRSMAAMDYDGKVPQSAVAQPPIEKRLSGDDQDEALVSDKPGTRLEMVRHIMLDYMIPALNGNQIGIVSYAGKAFPQAFLTRDIPSVRWVVDRGLTVSSAPGEGSAMATALEFALVMFEADSPASHEKLLIIFSDGGNDDSPERLAAFAQEARKRNIKVLVLGLGNLMPSKIPVSKLAADDDYARALRSRGNEWYEANGQIEKTALDAGLLQWLATASGGEYLQIQKMEDLDLMKYLGRQVIQPVAGTYELFPYTFIAAVIFLMLAFAATHEWSKERRR